MLAIRDVVRRLSPSIRNGEMVGRTSNIFGWLHTFRNCINTFITLNRFPDASVSLVLWKWFIKMSCFPFPMKRKRNSLCSTHKIIVQISLSVRQATHYDVLILFGHLFFHFRFQSTQQKRSQYFVQPLYDWVIVFGVAFDHASHWIGEPLLEFAMRLENVWHKEVHEWPQFHQIVL